MGIFDTLFPKPKNHFCQTPQLMEYMKEFCMKSDEELEKLARSKDTIKAAAAKSILEQRKRKAEENTGQTE